MHYHIRDLVPSDYATGNVCTLRTYTKKNCSKQDGKINMGTTRIFIGSSTEGKRQAKALVDYFESETVKFVTWWDAFPPGTTLLGQLDQIKNQVDAALLVFTPDLPAEVRGESKLIPNLNVMFEFGYFFGHLPAKNTALIRYGETYLPSDLTGYTYVAGSKFFKPGYANKVAKKTESSFNKWLAATE